MILLNHETQAKHTGDTPYMYGMMTAVVRTWLAYVINLKAS